MDQRRHAANVAGDPSPGAEHGRSADPRALRAAWCSQPSVAALNDALAGLAAAPGLTPAMAVSALAPWLNDRGWIGDFIARNIAALADDAWCELPWRVQSGPVLTGLVIAHLPGVFVMLSRLDADMLAVTETPIVVFDGGISIMMLIAGGVPAIETYVCSAASDALPTVRNAGRSLLTHGVAIACDCASQQIHIVDAAQDALLLRIVLTPPGGTTRIRAFERASGRLVTDGIAAPTSSRLAALLNVVGTGNSPRHRAIFAQLANHSEPFIRWQAMRRWLAADDSGAAHLALCQMAHDDSDAALRALAHATLQRIDTRMLARNAA